jgi:hypothetical protein
VARDGMGRGTAKRWSSGMTGKDGSRISRLFFWNVIPFRKYTKDRFDSESNVLVFLFLFVFV